MEPFLLSCALVAAAEMGDKTQLLSFVLAGRFKKPWPILAGILCATLANHFLAGWVGVWLASLVLVASAALAAATVLYERVTGLSSRPAMLSLP